MSTESKLGPNAVWLFAAATLGVAIALTYIVPHIIVPTSLTGYAKLMGGVYFAVFGLGATAVMYLSRVGVGRSIGAFALGGVGLGIFYYVVIARAFSGGGDAMSSAGSVIGLVTGVGMGISAIAAGIAGTLFGSKLRKGLPALGAAKR